MTEVLQSSVRLFVLITLSSLQELMFTNILQGQELLHFSWLCATNIYAYSYMKNSKDCLTYLGKCYGLLIQKGTYMYTIGVG